MEIDPHSPGAEWKRWLHDRETHRLPIDHFFGREIDNHLLVSTKPSFILELGPGSLTDLRDRCLSVPAASGWSNTYVAADILPGIAGVEDITADWQIGSIPFDDDFADLILAREVFEHVWQLGDMLTECRRILVPGGRLVFSTVFAFPLHDVETGDYWRISPAGWRRILSSTGFSSHEIETARNLFNDWQLPISILGTAIK